MVEAAASASTQAGLGGQMGAESALYMSRHAAPQFGHLSAKQQAAVGGSQDAYVQNLVSAQVNFASRNAASLAMGSYYVDPTTGAFKIDTNEVAAMAHRGFDPVEEQKRGMQILSKKNRKLLKTAGINQNFVTSALQENIGRLGKEAINFIDNDLQSAMSIKEINRTAADNGVTFNQAAASLGYSDEQRSALTTFAENIGKGGRRAQEEDRKAYLNELRTRGTSSQFISSSQRKDFSDRKREQAEANHDASLAAIRADRARAESQGIYGGRRRNYSDEEITNVISGAYDVIDSRDTLRQMTSRSNAPSVGGVFMGKKESDMSRGIMASAFHYSGHRDAGLGFLSTSVNETAAGKDVLSKLYNSEFYGKGTDVNRENWWGVDNSIMGRLAHGSYVSTNNLNRTFDANTATTTALQEIFGGSKNLEAQLKNITDPKVRAQLKALSSGSLAGDRGDNLSSYLASVAVRESAAFSDIGRSIRSSGNRANLLNIDDDATSQRVEAAAATIRRTINTAASTNTKYSSNKDSALAIHTSRQKMAQTIYEANKDKYKNVSEVMQDLPTILAAAYEGDSNTAKALDKLFEISETSRGLLGGTRIFTEGSSVLFEESVTFDDFIRKSNNKLVWGKRTKKGRRITLSDMALGDVEVGDDQDAATLIEESSISMAGAVADAATVKGYTGKGKAQDAIAKHVYNFVKFAHEKEYENEDKALAAYIRTHKDLRSLLKEMSPEHAQTVKTYMKKQFGSKKIRGSITSETGLKMDLDDYTKSFAGLLGVGKQRLHTDAIKDFIRDSDAVGKLFGEGLDLDAAADKVSKLMTGLHKGTFFQDQGDGKYVTDRGSVDIDRVLQALGFNKGDMDDKDYNDLYKVASRTFGSGNLGKDNQRKFNMQIQKQIDDGKFRSIGGVGGKNNNFAAIREAVLDMGVLQSATASLLAALASGDDTKLTAVARKLQGLQSKHKKKG